MSIEQQEETPIKKISSQLKNYRAHKEEINEKRKLKYIEIKDDEEYRNKNKLSCKLYYEKNKKSNRVKLTDDEKRERKNKINAEYRARQKQAKETAN